MNTNKLIPLVFLLIIFLPEKAECQMFDWLTFWSKERTMILSGAVINKDTGEGADNLNVTLDIIEKRTKKRIDGLEKNISVITDKKGIFKTEKLSIPKDMIKQRNKYVIVLNLPAKFCSNNEFEVGDKDISITSDGILWLGSKEILYGAAISGTAFKRDKEESPTALEGADIYIYDMDDKLIRQKMSEKDGSFKFPVITTTGAVSIFITDSDYPATSTMLFLTPGSEGSLTVVLSFPSEGLFKIPSSNTANWPNTFKDNGYPLFNPSYKLIAEGRWTVKSRRETTAFKICKEYEVQKREDGEIWCMKHRTEGKWLSDRFVSELDREIVSDELKSAFKCIFECIFEDVSHFPFTPDTARVEVEKQGEKWNIGSEKSYGIINERNGWLSISNKRN